MIWAGGATLSLLQACPFAAAGPFARGQKPPIGVSTIARGQGPVHLGGDFRTELRQGPSGSLPQ